MKNNFNLVLVDLQGELCQEFEKSFAGVEGVTVKHGQFEDVDFDCIVSAANSFGLMDGGVDGAITGYFGKQMMDRVQQHIINKYHGEQPIGTSFIIRGEEEWLLDGNNKYVAHTPTMRIPMRISNTDNVYQAMRSMLIAVKEFNEVCDDPNTPKYLNRINTVACTGLGTFCGEMPYYRAANQMRLAYDNFIKSPKSIDWDFANIRHREIFKSILK